MATGKNPFTPTFGLVPPHMAGREEIIDDLRNAFENGLGDPNLASILIGPRGVGKTALLSVAADEALEFGWVTASVYALPGMLEDILERSMEAASEFIDPKSSSTHITSVSFGNLFGIGWEYGPQDDTNWRTRMNAVLKALGSKDIGLLIEVDEVVPNLDEMIQLAAAYQQFIREGKRVALLMAGLPGNISLLLNDKTASFLRRARQHHLGRVFDHEVRAALKKTVEEAGRAIGNDALDAAVREIDGFPYLMQLVGYRMWADDPADPEISLESVRNGIEMARGDMRDGVYRNTLRDLSSGDVAYLRAMLADAGISKTSEIAARMGRSAGYASQYRRRLIEQGVIGERGYGKVGVDIPGFKEFLREELED